MTDYDPAKDEMYIVNSYIKHLEETRDKYQNEISNYRILELRRDLEILKLTKLIAEDYGIEYVDAAIEHLTSVLGNLN